MLARASRGRPDEFCGPGRPCSSLTARSSIEGGAVARLQGFRSLAVICLAVGAVAVLASPAVADTATIADEPFSGVSVPTAVWSIGGLNTPCLTAATVSAVGSIPACPGAPLDSVGDGALRFTDAAFQTGFAILNTPLDTSLGLKIQFDFFQYNNPIDPGDGMSFFLIDGAVSPTEAGSYGAGMGYASYHPQSLAGLAGGVVGVAFDSFGAFSDPVIGSGGPGVATPNSVAVRGDEASDYFLLLSHAAAGPLAVPAATLRDDARRHVVVTISKLNVMSIAVDYGAGLVTEIAALDLETANGAGSLPSTLKLGFAGSTGGAHLTTEIQNFQIEALPPDPAPPRPQLAATGVAGQPWTVGLAGIGLAIAGALMWGSQRRRAAR